MKYIDADKLIAEIERYENTAIDAYNPLGEDADFWHGKVVACEELKTLITSLQQEMELPEKYQTPDWLFEGQEQPVEGLEEEIEREWNDCDGKHSDTDYHIVELTKDDFLSIARHFAEWGARHSINWGDVQLLDTFILELSREEKDGTDWGDSEKFYTEVLRRFHEFNDKKISEIVAEWGAEHLKK